MMITIAHKEQPVYGERIREARELRGFSQSVLADLVNVKRQAVSAFEKSRISPSAETLYSISSVTEFPIPFFLNDRPRGDSTRTTPISFRKKAAASKTAKHQAEQYENILADIYFYTKNYIDYNPANIPYSGEYDYRTLDKIQIEQIASNVRKAWGLGNGPIPYMTRLLENNGIIIASIELPNTLDAFSAWRHNRPFILLSDESSSCVRRRFNLAHELGHLVLHSTVDDIEFEDTDLLKKLEIQAHRFAGAFLFPEKSVLNEYFSNSMSALIKLKGRWKISISAIAKRFRDLGLINEHQHKYIMVQLGSLRKNEPLDNTIPITDEEPAIMKRVFDILLKNNILSIQNAIDDLMISDNIFSMLTGIIPENSNSGKETIIPFKIKS
jgi:Zn-dependent peptidase ImmA (M78 family)/transcriptional regulator with XRE-family HTH domain